MKQIAQFYTLFWVIYFPTCIAFNDVGPMKWVDEIMTVILIAFTMAQMGSRYVMGPRRSFYRHETQVVKKEAGVFLLVLTFFTGYSLLFGENIQKAVWRDMVQWIRPFSVIYCTWLLNPRFTLRQKNLMLYSMIATMVAWLFLHAEAVTGAEAEFPVLGQLAMCTGLAWYLFKPQSRQNMYIATALVLAGMLAPKFKYLGEVVCFIYVIFFLKKHLRFKDPKTIVALVVMMAAVLFVTWEKFDFYYVQGFTDQTEYRLARPETYRIAFTQILWDYFPFGPGMGTWGCAAAADYYSPLLYKYKMNEVWGCSPDFPYFIADAFYPTLCQLGVVGVGLFCWFWKRLLVRFNKIRDMRYYKVVWITFFCLAIEQSADTSFLSGKGMGYCMLIALCLNANRNAWMVQKIKEQREKQKLANAAEQA